jgi:carboxypeptidase C (cathepsin A)
MTVRSLVAAFFLAALASAPAAAREAADAAASVDDPKTFVTEHRGRFGDRGLRYRVEAGEMHLPGEDGEPDAAIFTFAYLAEEAGTDRPVTFVFNGGPGSASLWLHMGLLGPKRVVVPSEADADDGAAPYRIVDNPATILDVTDLVFVDPIGTGFSRVVGDGETADYWSMQGDAGSLSTLIRRWITEHDRWNAPKYLIGESFGTTRAALIADTLSGDGQDVALNGIVMISQAMDYTGSSPAPDNLIAYVTYLPTMAATAWYHDRAGQGRPLQDFLDDARAFATHVYLPALFRGSALSPQARRDVAAQLAQFTGLSVDYIRRADLRITVPRFTKELLRDDGLAVGRLDSRYTADEADDTADSPHLGDAASNGITSAYTAAMYHYMGTELGVDMDRPYRTSNSEVSSHWNYRPVPEGQWWEPNYVNTARALSDALRKNADLDVLVANGYYDLVTPFFDAEYTLARHGILSDRIAMTYYEAGHMMYTREADFDALMRDIRRFYADDGLGAE